MNDFFFFFKKWGIAEQIPIESLFEKIEKLEKKYDDLLLNVKNLEEENIETTNVLYEALENIRAVDARLDILFNEFK